MLRDGIGHRYSQLHHTSGEHAVGEQRHHHTEGNAEECQESVEQSGGACEVMLVGKVAHTVGERHSWDKGDDGADNHIGQMKVELKIEN